MKILDNSSSTTSDKIPLARDEIKNYDINITRPIFIKNILDEVGTGLLYTFSFWLSNQIKWGVISKKLFPKYPGLSDITAPKKPILEQTLSSDQIGSITESYNRKIYKEIKNSQ